MEPAAQNAAVDYSDGLRKGRAPLTELGAGLPGADDPLARARGRAPAAAGPAKAGRACARGLYPDWDSGARQPKRRDACCI